MTYSVTIDGTTTNFSGLKFKKEHPNDEPDELEEITVPATTTVSQNSIIIVYKNSTILWKGKIRKVKKFWNKEGRWKKLTGKSMKIMIWKKFLERFERGDIDGFFGSVNPTRLARFLLRCPVSDSPTTSAFQRLGYGLDPTNWTPTAISKTDLTHESWVKLRQLGFAWQLASYNYTGNRYVDGYTQENMDIGGVTRKREWMHSSDTLTNVNENKLIDAFTTDDMDWTGVNTSPWLHDDDEVNYISQIAADSSNGTVASFWRYQIFGYDAMDLDRATTAVYLKAKLYDGVSGHATSVNLDVYLWSEQLQIWWKAGTMVVTDTSWQTESFLISGILSQYGDYDQIKNLRMKIIFASHVGGGDGKGGVNVTYSYLHVEGVGFDWNDTASLLGDDDDLTYVEARRNERFDSYWDFDDVDNPTDTGGNSRDWRSHVIGTAELKLYGKNVHYGGSGYEVDCQVYVKLSAGGSWTSIGTVSWGATETSFATKTLNLLTTFPNITITELNYLKMRLRCTLNQSGGDVSYMRIARSWLNLEITESSYQRDGDWFKVDLGTTKSNVMGILVECRNNSNLYARNFNIQTSVNGTDWTTQVTRSNNAIRDILESWTPCSARYVKIEITTDDDSGWEISQIFVWCSDGTYYIQDITISEGNFEDYGSAIEAISFGLIRTSDALGQICQSANDSYTPWEWWVDYDVNNTFHLGTRRGSDKSGSVIFVRGTHFDSCEVEETCEGTEQRVRVIGRGEGKDQEELISDWQVNSTGLSEIGGTKEFHEKIISDKTVGNKDQADVLANVHQTLYGLKRVSITVDISNDEFEGQYEVGDDVWITDSLNSLDAKYRVVSIEREISGSEGDVTNRTALVLSNCWYDIADMWAEIKRQLRDVGLTGTIVSDWRAEGANQTKISADKVEDLWSHNAKNDTQSAPADENDDRWSQSGRSSYNQDFECSENYFKITGSKHAGFTETHTEYINEPSIVAFDDSPKFLCEFKIIVAGSDPAGATQWATGDYLYIRMFSGSALGFGFRIIKTASGYELYAFLRDSDPPERIVKIQDVDYNVVYRIEAAVDWDAKIVKYSVDDVLKGVFAFGATEGGSGSNLYPLYLTFVTSNPNPVTTWAWAYIYRYKSEWEWTK